MSTVIAEKQLDYFVNDRVVPGFIRIVAPEPDGDWLCRYQLSWPGYEREFGITGADSLQALVLALRVISSVVGATDDFKNGRIGVYGQRLSSFEDLDREIGLSPIGTPQ